MTHAHLTEPSRPDERKPAMRLPWKLIVVGLLVIATFFVITEHRAHLLGAGPYLIAIIAALFCMLGHRHGVHHGRGGER
jgi:hypothetical protein